MRAWSRRTVSMLWLKTSGRAPITICSAPSSTPAGAAARRRAASSPRGQASSGQAGPDAAAATERFGPLEQPRGGTFAGAERYKRRCRPVREIEVGAGGESVLLRLRHLTD